MYFGLTSLPSVDFLVITEPRADIANGGFQVQIGRRTVNCLDAVVAPAARRNILPHLALGTEEQFVPLCFRLEKRERERATATLILGHFFAALSFAVLLLLVGVAVAKMYKSRCSHGRETQSLDGFLKNLSSWSWKNVKTTQSQLASTLDVICFLEGACTEHRSRALATHRNGDSLLSKCFTQPRSCLLL